MTKEIRKPRAIAIAATRQAAEFRRQVAYLTVSCLSATVALTLLALKFLG
ncbi:hypothetical protein [Peteryoungia ipomoeae]|nr:hypothetical protein [Peteryoungia ipomoeae]